MQIGTKPIMFFFLVHCTITFFIKSMVCKSNYLKELQIQIFLSCGRDIIFILICFLVFSDNFTTYNKYSYKTKQFTMRPIGISLRRDTKESLNLVSHFSFTNKILIYSLFMSVLSY